MTLALSIQQPWAWCIANGFKEVENRSWYTYIRAVILIHAGKTIDREAFYFITDAFPEIPLPSYETMKTQQGYTGGIVGQSRIVKCVTKEDGYESPWFFGPNGFILRDSKPLPFRPCKGKLGFFTPNYDDISQPKSKPQPQNPQKEMLL